MKIKKITKEQVQMVLPALFALLLIGFFVNRNIQIRGLYGDDLYLWSYYGEDNFWDFTFPAETKGNFRPFYWAMSYLEFFIIGRHVNYYAAFNTVINILISFVIYFFGLRLTRAEERYGLDGAMSNIAALLAGAMYLGSHFAAYQIGQVLGLLESLALVLAILVLWFLYEYTTHQGGLMYYGACFMYFLVIFTHERYIALFPLFYIALVICFISKRKTHALSRRRGARERFLLKALIPVLELVLFFMARLRIAGQAMPAGTAGTEVTETFDLIESLGYAVMQVQYIFGVNAGEAYLNGLTWSDAPTWLHICVYMSWLVIALMLIIYVMYVIKQGISHVVIGQHILFLSFIALCIGCSSITVRLEIRWIYVSYTAALLYICYMLGGLRDRRDADINGDAEIVRATGTYVGAEIDVNPDIDEKSSRGRMGRSISVVTRFAALFVIYCILMTPVEQLYRSNFKNMFFWFDLDRVNSLADQTIGKYKDFLGTRQTYIFYNLYEMTDFYAEYFYKPYDPLKTGQGSEVHFINDVSELPLGADYNNSVVLLESSDRRGYIDITDQVFGKADWDAITQTG